MKRPEGLTVAKAALRKRLQTVLIELSNDTADPSVSPVAAATALDALGLVPGAELVANAITQRIAPLVGEQWIMTADLCTVFSVLAALHAQQPATVQGRYLACALKRLMTCEVAPGGPYRSGPDQVEPAANAAVARFLRRYDVSLPQLTLYLDDQATRAVPGSAVVTREAFWYLAAPVLSPQIRETLVPGGLKKTGHPVLHLATLRLLGDRHQIDTALLATPLTRPLSFYKSASPADSRLLANALLAEVLALVVAPARSRARAPSVAGGTGLHTEILRDTKQYIADLPSELRTTGLAAWDAMRRADGNHEIVLLPRMFADTLKDATPLTTQRLRVLGAANFFCWIAAMIYDDFIDEEGEPGRLPVANTAYRLSLNLYRQALTIRPALNRYVEHVYDQMDAANAWEVAHTRAPVIGNIIKLPALPDYDDYMVLAQRALGHVIGPMLVVMLLPGIRSKQIDAIDGAMRHFLIARQLNDDLHDWRKDLRAGHLSPVVVTLLQGAQVAAGEYLLSDLIPRLERYFFAHGLYDVCTRLRQHVSESRKSLAASGVCGTSGGFIELLDSLDASAAAAVGVQTDERAFLDAYRELVSSP